MLAKEQQFAKTEHAPVFLLTDMYNVFKEWEFIRIDLPSLRCKQFRYKFINHRDIIRIAPAVGEAQTNHV
jgi:hypothetical protein